MKAWILSVGDEVLSGRVVNTNASYLSLKLENIGIITDKMIVVGDDDNAIHYQIQEFMNGDSEILISTGGLGPTHDDFTKESIAKALGLELQFFKEAEDNLKKYFKNKTYTACNLKQTYFPKGSKIIPNELGTACGAILEISNKIIMILVGPPYELKPMFESTCIPYLQKITNNYILTKNYTIMGVGESEIEPTIMEIISRHPNVKINPYFSIGKIRFQLTSDISLEDEFKKAQNDFELTLGDLIISDQDSTIEEVLVQRLKELKYKISFCESCTGGILASKIINVSGASSVIYESLITYSEESKIKYLNVKQDTIEKYDVASIEVAREMVEGLYELTKSEICISVTGVAGPTTTNPLKPVGSVYFGVAINGKVTVFENLFKGSRDIIRNKAAMWILYQTYLMIKKR